MTRPFRSIPSVERVLCQPVVRGLMKDFPHQVVVELVRARLDDAREAITDGGQTPSMDELVGDIAERAKYYRWPRPMPVVNATGVILHTNLGRAPLSNESLEAMQRAGKTYSDLELDLENGRRGSRQKHVAELLCQLTGSEAAIVVNNNASAVLLGLAAVATGREVIVSRGDAVEIGGGFRIPDVLRQSGATLVEVGTTNRTYARDYESAITERSGAILSVHASNFRMTGFIHAPEVKELVDLGRQHELPVLHDLGSGCLLDTRQFGLAREPMPQDSVQAGVDLAFFSGDKLLGGPQAGIIVGKKKLISIVSRHPLARAVRIDKLSLAALSATLVHYIKEEAVERIPIWRMIAATDQELESRACRWGEVLGQVASVERSTSTIGGGSLPGETLPSWVLSIDAKGMKGGAQRLASNLRQGDHPVVGRIEEERVLLDPRTVLPDEEEALIQIVSRVLSTVDPD